MLTVMALPRDWEHGQGRVPAATPQRSVFRQHRNGRITTEAYRAHIVERMGRFPVGPGEIKAIVEGRVVPVGDGDTLCCGCSRDKAAEGRCHRVWVAEALLGAGWRVVLDGRALPDGWKAPTAAHEAR